MSGAEKGFAKKVRKKMKVTKILAMGIAAVMAVSAMSISAFATNNENEIIYTYIDENNNEVNLTQADYDAEHWDKDALGDTAPFIYADFPMFIDSHVNDYSDLRLNLTYLKTLSDAEQVSLTITDLYDDTEIYSENVVKNLFASPNLEMNKAYKLTISETFNGVTKEYYKVVMTSVEEAKMPNYVKAPSETDDTIILVGNVDDLRASTSINQDGETEIDTDMPRYTQIKACELSEYINALPTGKLYRVYTRDSANNKYFGFISTKSDIDGIFMPSITVHKWKYFNSPAPYASISSYSPEDIRDGATTPMVQYRDYGFSFSSEDRQFEVFKFTIPEQHDSNDVYAIDVHANDVVTVEVWTKQAKNNVLAYQDQWFDRKGYVSYNTTMCFTNPVTHQLEDFVPGDEYYVVVSFSGSFSNAEGSVSIQCTSDTDDVTGSAYEAYQQWKKGNYTQYSSYTPFYITNDNDADVFFLNCGTSSVNNYVRIKSVPEKDKGKYNNKYTKRDKYVELATNYANYELIHPGVNPSDIMTMSAGSSLRFSSVSKVGNEKFVYIYNVPNADNSKNDIYLLRRYNN